MAMQLFVDNGEVLIEYFSNQIQSDKPPVIISMGNWEPAFRGLPLLNTINDRLCISLSYRGRGMSSTPEYGWDWENHASDLQCVIEREGIKRAVFIALSKGVSYTLGYLEKWPMTTAGLILIDYPAIHEPAVKGYAQFWHSMEYNGISLKDNVRLAALEGIERESTEKDFYEVI